MMISTAVATTRNITFGLAIVISAMVPARSMAADGSKPVAPSEPTIHFQSVEEARATLTGGSGADYFELLDLPEMRAKTGLAFVNTTVEEARAQTKAHYAANVMAFTPAEIDAVSGLIIFLQPGLQRFAALYAREPWSFVKVNNAIEGGLPYTRGQSIVLEADIVDGLVAMKAKGGYVQAQPYANLLVHEQTHVLQERYPALFNKFYVETLGFVQIVPPQSPPWLTDRKLVNPDGPVAEWIFNIQSADAPKWILPELLVRDVPQPKMPDDFEVIAAPVVQKGNSWVFVDQTQPKFLLKLADVTAYEKAFPDNEEDFHPNEISAGMIAGLLTGFNVPHPEHPLWKKTRQWILDSLQ